MLRSDAGAVSLSGVSRPEPASSESVRGKDRDSTERGGAVVLDRLSDICETRKLGTLETKLEALRVFLADDLGEVERDLQALKPADTPLHQSARHLVSGGGKRLRPLCVALASRLGTPQVQQVRDLGVAAELIHSATLLHDDVVDVGDRRRGAVTARLLYGNAASIFAGDYLLVDALRRVRRTGLSDVLDRLLSVLVEMLEAESLQLARRGVMVGGEAAYLSVIEGKTASLFEWAMFAGARAGGLPAEQCVHAERFGRQLGIAFQIVDDALDVGGDEAALGKAVLSDLREGKLTYPLMLAVEHRPEVGKEIERALASEAPFLPADAARDALAAMEACDAVRRSFARAQASTDEAVTALSHLPKSAARDILAEVATALAHRST